MREIEEKRESWGKKGFMQSFVPQHVHVSQVLLESGSLVTFTVARHSGDIENMLIDRSLIPRLDGPLDKGQKYK